MALGGIAVEVSAGAEHSCARLSDGGQDIELSGLSIGMSKT